MGMYTCLFVHCKVKKKYIEYIGCINMGDDWNYFIEQMPFIKKYSKDSRSGFIPRGMLSAYNEDKVGPEKFSVLDMKTGDWCFNCDLKNYDGTIQCFIKTVLPYLCDRVYECFYWYEEDEEPKVIDEKEIFAVLKEKS